MTPRITGTLGIIAATSWMSGCRPPPVAGVGAKNAGRLGDITAYPFPAGSPVKKVPCSPELAATRAALGTTRPAEGYCSEGHRFRVTLKGGYFRFADGSTVPEGSQFFFDKGRLDQITLSSGAVIQGRRCSGGRLAFFAGERGKETIENCVPRSQVKKIKEAQAKKSDKDISELQGLVVDVRTEKPISGAVVKMQDSVEIKAEDGVFVIVGLKPGAYSFEVSAVGYVSDLCKATIPPPTAEHGGDAASSESAVVKVVCPLHALPKVGNIAGAIVAADLIGSPIADATVTIFDRLNRSLTLTSDNAGNYRFENVPPGRVEIRVQADGYLPTAKLFSIVGNKDITGRIELHKLPKVPNVVVGAREIKLKKPILFQLNSTEIQPDSIALLEEIALAFAVHGSIGKVEVQGHTDNTGDPVYNIRLSQDRAEEVVRLLTLLATDSSRLVAKGYGQDKPLVPNTSERNRAKNVRIQLMILKRGE